MNESLLPARQKIGYLVTNHKNLMYMLAAGMVLPQSGLEPKYYRDTLAACPGWLPLFTQTPTKAAVEHSVAEAGHLMPCIVEIDLETIEGAIWLLEESGLREGALGEEVSGSPLLFLPAPLPTSSIRRILLKSGDDKNQCRAEAAMTSNVPWLDFEPKADKNRFGQAGRGPWPPPATPPPREAQLGVPAATGGVLAMLRLMANRFDPSQAVDGTPPLGVAACRWAYGGEATSDSEGGIMVGLSAWVRGEQPRTEGRSPWDALFWGIVDKLARADAAKGDDARRIVLDYLNDGSLSLRDQERKRVQNLRDSLESLLGLPEATQGELFQRYTTPLPRALLLLFLRETCAELAAFESPVLKEEDWLAAAVLFGAKDGLLGVPLELRGGCASSAAITHRMAALSQRMAGSGMELGAAPRRRNPLAEYFIGTWGAREREAALDLARRQKFDCIETRVALPNGAYALDVNRGGMELVLRGEAKAVTTAANREQFLGCLRQAVVEPKHEQAVIDLLDPEPNDRA